MPGPGNYKVPEIISPQGKYCASNIRNVPGTSLRSGNDRFDYCINY